MTTPPTSTGSDLTELLAAYGCSIAQLANRMGLAHQTIANWCYIGVPESRRRQLVAAVVHKREAVRLQADQFATITDRSGLSTQQIAEQIGTTRTTVATWRTKGVPAHWYEDILDFTTAHRIKIPPPQKLDPKPAPQNTPVEPPDIAATLKLLDAPLAAPPTAPVKIPDGWKRLPSFAGKAA